MHFTVFNQLQVLDFCGERFSPKTEAMRSILPLTILVLSLSACNKPRELDRTPPPPVGMHYINLRDMEIPFNSSKAVDLNGDLQADYNFKVFYTGDAAFQKDNFFFQVDPKQQNLLLNNGQDDSPMVNSSESIGGQYTGFGWLSQTQVTLAQKSVYSNGNITWQGLWKHASHKFVAVQLRKNNQSYFGWVELSLDGGSNRLVLHKAGVSLQPNKEVKAGE